MSAQVGRTIKIAADKVQTWMAAHGFERVGSSWMSGNRWARVEPLTGGRVAIQIGVSTRG